VLSARACGAQTQLGDGWKLAPVSTHATLLKAMPKSQPHCQKPPLTRSQRVLDEVGEDEDDFGRIGLTVRKVKEAKEKILRGQAEPWEATEFILLTSLCSLQRNQRLPAFLIGISVDPLEKCH
jgi:hypothetical protein